MQGHSVAEGKTPRVLSHGRQLWPTATTDAQAAGVVFNVPHTRKLRRYSSFP